MQTPGSTAPARRIDHLAQAAALSDTAPNQLYHTGHLYAAGTAAPTGLAISRQVEFPQHHYNS
jgi:hypothetical protein